MDSLATNITPEEMEWANMIDSVILLWGIAIKGTMDCLSRATYFDTDDCPRLVKDVLEVLDATAKGLEVSQ